jgi:hypothetical protein
MSNFKKTGPPPRSHLAGHENKKKIDGASSPVFCVDTLIVGFLEYIYSLPKFSCLVYPWLASQMTRVTGRVYPLSSTPCVFSWTTWSDT